MSDHGFAEVSDQPQLPPTASGDRPSSRSSHAAAASLDDASAARVSSLEEKTVISRPTPLISPESRPVLPEMDELLGTELGHVRIESFVGGGGMGAVFRGLDLKLDRPVAVKVLARQQSLDSDLVRRFQNEARSAARLDHENVARVYDFGTDRGWHYIVFEFVDGWNIRDLVYQQGPLDVATALAYVRQIAEALQHSADREVVHRDVKPSNVVITTGGRVKLVDMGLARLLQVQPGEEDLTASGVTLGTFDYISPEQARDPRLVDVRSDVYSLGCTLFFMLTGIPPFPHASAVQKLLSHSNDPPPDPRQFRTDLPEEVVWILHRMLAKNPHDRYQQPQEIIADIAAVCQQYGWQLPGPITEVVVRRDDPLGKWWERHLVWFAPLIILGSLIVLLEALDPSRSAGHLVIPRLEAVSPSRPVASSLPGATSADQGVPEGSNNSAGGTTAGDSLPSATPPARQRPSGGNPPQTPPAVTPSPPGESAADATSPEKSSTGREPVSRAGMALDSVSLPATSPFDWPLPSQNDDPPKATPSRPSRIIVAPNYRAGKSDEEVFTSLSMAVDMLRRSSIRRIELHYDGLGSPGMELQDPLELRGLEVTIAAGPGYRPVLRYRPMGDALFDVQNSRLHVEGVDFEMEFPPDAMAGGALFKLQDARSLTLDHCTFTVRTTDLSTATYAPEAIIVDAFSSQPAPEGRAAEFPLPQVQVQMSDCIVRGETVLLRALDGVPMDFVWRNGLYVSNQRMFRLGGSSRRPDARDLIRVHLEHVTAHCPSGLCLLTTDRPRPYYLPVDLDLTDCILVGSTSSGMIRQAGVQSRQAFQEQLDFRGERNFYERIAVFWKIEPSGQEPPAELYYLAWKDHWRAAEQAPHYQEVQWESFPSASIPLAERLPSDYRLDESPANPARHSAADMGSAGADLSSLPRLAPMAQQAVD